MTGNRTIRQWLILVALSPFVLLIFLLLVLGAPFYLAYRLLLRLAFEALAAVKGRRVLLVYSRSPVWQEYVENHWLPRLADQAMVLNWSDRAAWKGQRSFASWVFRHWAPPRNFNPMVIVFPRFRPARRVGFYDAFRDWKHGNEKSLRDAELLLFDYLACLDEGQKPNAQ